MLEQEEKPAQKRRRRSKSSRRNKRQRKAAVKERAQAQLQLATGNAMRYKAHHEMITDTCLIDMQPVTCRGGKFLIVTQDYQSRQVRIEARAHGPADI
ncbi:MAG: hypothetical protein KTR15_07810 [Phycisphaeraceae bacterium]|nr:hypothetical protein [Phycisphaeraceae bacterium]